MPKYDPRLIGAWKSDRRKTFAEFTPRPSAPPEAVRRLKNLFGHMIVTWGRTRVETRLHADHWIDPYEFIARDDASVVVRVRNPINDRPTLIQIHFEEDDLYWLVGPLGYLREYFRRVPSDKPPTTRSRRPKGRGKKVPRS